jgi:hypothetical protein
MEEGGFERVEVYGYIKERNIAFQGHYVGETASDRRVWITPKRAIVVHEVYAMRSVFTIASRSCATCSSPSSAATMSSSWLSGPLMSCSTTFLTAVPGIAARRSRARTR